MLELFKHIFSQFGVQYTTTYLAKLLAETPYSDSLYGISALLYIYNVPNVCVRYVNKERLSPADVPCIVLHNGRFVFISRLTEKYVTLFLDGKYLEIPVSEFIESWNGIALIIMPNGGSKEPNYVQNQTAKNLNSVKYIGIISCVFVLMGMGFLNAQTKLVQLINIVINIFGIAISMFLLQKQLHMPNKMADKICGLAKDGYCEGVTESDGATLFGLVKLSEVGFGFFLTNLVALLVFPNSTFWLAIYVACVLPFSFWSIWYQKYKAKSWCVLCLSTLFLMWLQAGIYLIGGVYSSPHGS